MCSVSGQRRQWELGVHETSNTLSRISGQKAGYAPAQPLFLPAGPRAWWPPMFYPPQTRIAPGSSLTRTSPGPTQCRTSDTSAQRHMWYVARVGRNAQPISMACTSRCRVTACKVECMLRVKRGGRSRASRLIARRWWDGARSDNTDTDLARGQSREANLHCPPITAHNLHSAAPSLDMVSPPC
jgi:hypothetical protein